MIVTERGFLYDQGRKSRKISGEKQTGAAGAIVCAGSSLMEMFPVEKFVKRGVPGSFDL